MGKELIKLGKKCAALSPKDLHISILHHDHFAQRLETTEEIKRFINSTAFRDFIFDIVESGGKK